MSFSAILTTLGLSRLATAQATNTPLVFTHVAVGDGNGSPVTPVASMTALVHETARVTVNAVDLDTDVADAVRVEGLFPADVGGFTIREGGLFNGAGELIAVASFPDIYKAVPADGASVPVYIRIPIEYAGVATAISITVDDSVVMATRSYVDDRMALLFGDGSDGDYTLDGTQAAVAGLFSKASNTYTLLRDAFFNNLTVTGASVKLVTGGFRLFVKDTLTTVGGAKVTAEGAPGTPGAFGVGGGGGAGGASGTLLSGGAGGGCGNNAAGQHGSNMTASYGGAGGAGGADAGGVHAGGDGGTVTAPAAALGTPRMMQQPPGFISGISTGVAIMTAITGGGGGGGAGADATAEGGGGGAGGGVLVVFARSLVLASAADIFSGGGKGGDTNEANTGGGGGGGGGVLIIAYENKNAVTFSAAINCPGGTGGAKSGTGGFGSPGSDGTVIEMRPLP